MLADQRAGTANIEQQKQQLEKEYNELLDQKENLKKDYNKRISEVQEQLSNLVGKIATTTSNIATTKQKLDNERALADKSAIEIKKRIDDNDITITQAQSTTNKILEHYGAQPGSDVAVNSTLDLLQQLLYLPESIVKGGNNYIQFKAKIVQLAENLDIGIGQIQNGSVIFPPFDKSSIGVCYWFKTTFPGNLIIADNAFAVGLDYNYLVYDLTEEDIRESLKVKSQITINLILRKRNAMKSTNPAEYDNPFEVDTKNPPKKELANAINLISYGMTRIRNELDFFKQVADDMNGPLQGSQIAPLEKPVLLMKAAAPVKTVTVTFTIYFPPVLSKQTRILNIRYDREIVEEFIKAYRDNIGLPKDVGETQFLYKGNEIRNTDTPESLNLPDNADILVQTKSVAVM